MESEMKKNIFLSRRAQRGDEFHNLKVENVEGKL